MRAQLGRRQRRVRRVLLGVFLVGLLGGLAGVFLYRAKATETYRPGEDLADITTALSRSLPAGAPMPSFEDVTKQAGLADVQVFAGGRSSQLPEDMGGGLAWADFDRDGDDDLFVVGGGALAADPQTWAPCRLLVNQGDGSFVEHEDFPLLQMIGMGAAWGDANGDGWPDLAVSGYRSLTLLWNREGTFEVDEYLEAPDGFWAAPSWADFDLDGDLDLYVTGYVRYSEPQPGAVRQSTQQYSAAVPYTLNPASYEPERNLLFQNDGRGRFREVAAELGVDNPGGRSLSALWHDFDDDGRPDLYVANDISDNAFYRNQSDGFVDAGLAAWVADYRGAMGVAVGDWNRDGDDDMFVTHWVAQENALYDSQLTDSVKQGNSPLLAFSDKAAPLGLGQIALQRIGWGAEFGDFDADGWLDLVVANGSTFESDGDPPGLKPQQLFFLWNQAGTYFHDLADLNPALAREAVWRGLAVADYDLDGDLDIAVSSLDDGVHLLRNDMQVGHWLVLRPILASGAEARGATLQVTAGEIVWRRAVTGASYLSQSSAAVHVGLGDVSEVSFIDVHWPGGEVERFPGVAADAAYRLVEGSGQTVLLAGAARELSRDEIRRFWEFQRAAMDLVKVEQDPEGAVPLFRQALELEPAHEDARYYLANCLAVLGQVDEAVSELEHLQQVQPQSHRAFKRAGALRALKADSTADLERAAADVRRALQINQEAIGALLLLAELDLLLGRDDAAETGFTHVCQTNPRSVGGLFMRAYLAWYGGKAEDARQLLLKARDARGEDWKPEGAVAEGDVAQQMHREASPLSRFWEQWNGESEPGAAMISLDAEVTRWRQRRE